MTIEAKQRGGQSSQKVFKQEEPASKYWDPLQEGVKWIEKYGEPLEKFFERLPEFISTFVATLAVFTFGSLLRGNQKLSQYLVIIKTNYEK